MNINQELKEYKIDCSQCVGLCCKALFFFKIDGFPQDKKAGVPCMHLQSNHQCEIHQELHNKGYKGCTSYDCIGAGQYVSTNYSSVNNEQMYIYFEKVKQIHEVLWYILDALRFTTNPILIQQLTELYSEIKALKQSNLEVVNIVDVQNKVNPLLKEVVKEINTKNKCQSKLPNTRNFSGKDLRNYNLIGANFAGCLLIGTNLRNTQLSYTNFIGTDLRDTQLHGANLEHSIFLTQNQINSAQGNKDTKLPKHLIKPNHW